MMTNIRMILPITPLFHKLETVVFTRLFGTKYFLISFYLQVSECHERGQYLADPENKCNYRRCVVMSEPWQQNGAIPLDIITDQCPAGTAVPHGYHSGKDNPCSVFDDTCGGY